MEHIVDIHMHLVPGVDDGSRSLRDSEEMIRSEVAQGVGTIFATPHSFAFDWNPARVRVAFEELRQYAARLELPVSLYLGCEILVSPETADSCVYDLNRGIYPSMGGTRYVLIEFDPYSFTLRDAEICVRKFTAARYIPIVAHAERYLFTDADGVRALKELGAAVQINAYSVREEQDPQIRDAANALLDRRLADFIGTDAHRPSHRPPRIAEGVAAIEETVPPGYARQICVTNARERLIPSQRSD